MVKILFFIEKFAFNGAIGGAERVLINLVNHMNHDKYDVTVITKYPEREADQLVPSVHYRTLFPKKTKFNEYRYRFEMAIGLLYRLRMQSDYDIECAFLECGSTKALSTSTNKNAKKVAWVHCDFSVAFGEKFIRKCSPWYQKYDQIVCVSEKAKESFIRYFGNANNTTVIHNVVDSDLILQKSSEPLPEYVQKNKLTVLCVGRLTPPKNPIRLLKVHKRLVDEGIDHDLWWVGDGEQKDEVKKAIQELGLCKTVTLFGFQNNPYPFIREADICVCSSNYEGYSTFITESVILGKVIVTTDCSGMKEILGESEYGIVTNNSDDDLFTGLKDVLLDNSKREKLEKKSLINSERFLTQSLVYQNELFFDKLT